MKVKSIICIIDKARRVSSAKSFRLDIWVIDAGVEVHKHTQKRRRPISSHLDLTLGQ